MWRTTAPMLAILCLAALGTSHSLPQEPHRYFQASPEFLQRQMQILRLFWWQYDTEKYESDNATLSSFHLEDNLVNFKNPEPVLKFLSTYKEGNMFPQTKLFTLFEEWPREQAIVLFEMLLYAKDFHTFYKTALYTRELVNRGMFYHMLLAVLEAREDTRYFYYPPMYEIYPYTFLDERVIQKAMLASIRALEAGKYEPLSVVANYSRYWDSNLDPENVLSYFREDVGLNMLNVEFHRRFPAWYNSSLYGEQCDRKGELFLYYQRQLLARYFLERLSNNLGDLPYITEQTPLVGYFPGLRHFNGEIVTPRQPFSTIRDTDEVSMAELKENSRRVKDAIRVGYFVAENGTKIFLQGQRGWDILGKVLGFVGDNVNYKYYNSIYNQELYLLGGGDAKISPSALLYPETALRDPLYYQNIYRFFKDFYYEYVKTLPQYTYDDVAYPGITIENVDVDKLITYFEEFDIDLSVVVGKGFQFEKNKIHVAAKTERLDHQPFAYRVSLTSVKEADVIIKVFITPKYDAQYRLLPLNERIMYAFEIDRFPAKVNVGKNVIQRKSTDSTVAVDDPPSAEHMYRLVRDAINGKETMKVDKLDRPYGFPRNLLLPKGRRSGLPVQFVVAVYPYQEADASDRTAYDMDSFTLLGTSPGIKYPDPRPIAFPIDRMYRSEYDAAIPNVFTKELRIFHKSREELTEGSS